MTSRHAIISKEGVLALLSKQHANTMTQAELGAAFGVTAQAAGNVLRTLVASGRVVVTKDKILPTLSYSLSAKAGAPIVPPFKWDIWTPPLRYNMRAHADLAMAARSA